MFGISKMKNFMATQDNITKLKSLLQESVSNTLEIKKLVSNDPKLNTLVLTVINNPLCGLEEKINDSDRAIDLLGLVQLHEMLFGEISMISMEKSIKTTRLLTNNRDINKNLLVQNLSFIGSL